MSRKPRSDSNLKTLPSEQQAEIMTRLSQKGGSYKAVAKWLHVEWDLTTSEAALVEFYSWYQLRQQVQEVENDTQALAELLQGSEFGLSADKVRELGNLMFITRATKAQDPKTFVAMARILVANRKLDAEERRIKLLEEKAAVAEKIEKTTKGKPSAEMTDEERAAVLKVVDESFGIKSPSPSA